MQRKGAVIVEAAFVMPFAITMLFYLVVAFLYFHDFYVMQSVTQQTARNIAVDAGSNIQTNAQTGIVYSEPQVVLEKYKKELNSLILYEVGDDSKISLKLEGDFIKNDAKVQAGKPYSTMSVKGAYVVLTSEVKRRDFIGEMSFPVCPESLYVQRKTRVELAMDTKLLYANNAVEEDVTIKMSTNGSGLVLTDSNNTYTLVLNDATDAFYKDYEMKWILRDKDGNVLGEAEYWYNMSAFENPDNDLYRKTTAEGEYYDFEVKRKDGFEMDQAERNVLLTHLKEHFVKSTVAVVGEHETKSDLMKNEYYSVLAASNSENLKSILDSDIKIQYSIVDAQGKNVLTPDNVWHDIQDLAEGAISFKSTNNYNDIIFKYEYQHADGSKLTDKEQALVNDYLANTRPMSTYGTKADLLQDFAFVTNDRLYISVDTEDVINIDDNEYDLSKLNINWKIYNSITDVNPGNLKMSSEVNDSEGNYKDFAINCTDRNNYKYIRFEVENGAETNYTKAELALIAEHLANSVKTKKFANNVFAEVEPSSIYCLPYDTIKQELKETYNLNLDDYKIKYNITNADGTNMTGVKQGQDGNSAVTSFNDKLLDSETNTRSANNTVFRSIDSNVYKILYRDITYANSSDKVPPSELAAILHTLDKVGKNFTELNNTADSATISSTQGCEITMQGDTKIDGFVTINGHEYDLSKYKITWNLYEDGYSYPIASGPITNCGDVYNVPAADYSVKINVQQNGSAVPLTQTALADLESYYTSKVSLSNSGTKNDTVVTSSDQVVIGVRHNDSGWKNTGLDNTASDGNYVTTKPTFITAGESYKVDLSSFDLDNYKVYVYVAGLKSNGDWENIYKLENITKASFDTASTQGGMHYYQEGNICTIDLSTEAVKNEKNNNVYNGYAVFYNVQAQDNKSTYAISKLPTDEVKIAVIAGKITLSVLQ